MSNSSCASTVQDKSFCAALFLEFLATPEAKPNAIGLAQHVLRLRSEFRLKMDFILHGHALSTAVLLDGLQRTAAACTVQRGTCNMQSSF